MENKYKIKIYFILLLFIGCTHYHIRTYHDEFDNYTYISMYLNKLGHDRGIYTNIELNLQRTEKNGNYGYILGCHYEARDWLFIDSGESLIMLIDNERIGFEGAGSLEHRDAYGSNINELAIYRIIPDQIKKIAYANEVKIRIKGKYYIECYFTDINFDNFRRFYQEYVENTSP